MVKCQKSLILECDSELPCGGKATYSGKATFQALQGLARLDGWGFPNVAICLCPPCAEEKKGKEG